MKTNFCRGGIDTGYYLNDWKSKKNPKIENCFSNSSSSSSFAHHANHSIVGVRSIFDLRSRLKVFFFFFFRSQLKVLVENFFNSFLQSYRWMMASAMCVVGYSTIKRVFWKLMLCFDAIVFVLFWKLMLCFEAIVLFYLRSYLHKIVCDS